MLSVTCHQLETIDVNGNGEQFTLGVTSHARLCGSNGMLQRASGYGQALSVVRLAVQVIHIRQLVCGTGRLPLADALLNKRPAQANQCVRG